MRLVVALTLAVLIQEPPASEEVQVDKDVVFGKGGGEELKLNIARPKEGTDPLPCVVVIHGGGWSGGNRGQLDELIWKLAKRGYVAATVSYRLAPKHVFPAQVEDVKCAVRYLRANADKYRLDPKRIGAVGFSAGAHLAMMLGVMGKEDGLEGEGGHAGESSQVSAVVSFFGPADLSHPDLPDASKGILKSFIGGTREEKPEEHKRASPVTYVTKGDATMLLFQGTKDPLVPHSQAYAMVEALTVAGVPARCELLVGAGHGWGGAELKRTEEASYAFLDEKLKIRR